MGIRILPAWLVRMVRGPRRLKDSVAGDCFVGPAPFTLVAETPGEEFVLGIMGCFWTPSGGVVNATAERFRELPPAGLAQAFWNFRIRPDGSGTELSTETRVRCGDEATRRQFRKYWRIVRPGSSLIRNSMLRHIRATAERVVSIVAAATFLGGWLQAQSTQRIAEADSARLARIDTMFAPYAGVDRPGFAVGIMQGGRLVYARGFGSASLEHGIPITPASAFNAASLAKQFTAASIGILIRRGKLSLNDEVKRHIPEFPSYLGAVRIKHLVYMTSGLPDYYTLPRLGGRTWDLDYFSNEDAIRTVLEQRLLFEPGSRWAYSNVNYMLLAEIVRRVSGSTLARFAQQEIFEPLGMKNSLFNDDLGAVVAHRVSGYNTRPSGGYQLEIRRSPHVGASGLFSTVEDLARWDRSFETHQLGGPGLTALLLSTMKFRHDKVNDAFGLVWGQYRGLRTIWYEGGDLGFSSYMVRFPDERFTVIVLSNLGTGRAGDHARRIIDEFLEAG
jgi:CubicO group peptidase (beta-lactamase class C family)